MKKFSKFLLGAVSITTIAAGAYYVYKNFIKNDYDDDLDDDFDDDFDDDLYTETDNDNSNESREYVSIQIDQKKVDEGPDTIENPDEEVSYDEETDDTFTSEDENITE